jgi:hypothetical protein
VNRRTLGILIALVCLALIASSAHAQITKTGTTAAKFLAIPVGPRAVAMGGAFSAVTNDASAMYWNPAGMAFATQNEALISHAEWIADLNFNYGGVIVPVPNFGTLGVNITSLTMGEMERTTETLPDGTGEFFNASSVAIGLSYARNLTDWFAVGVNVKYITENIWNSSANALAVDFGTLFDTPFEGLKFAAVMSNFGQKMQLSGDDLLVQKDISPIAGNNPNINANLTTDKFDIPLNLRIGFSYEVLNSASQNLILALDAAYPNDNSENLSIGAEYSAFNDLISLRAGYRGIGMEDTEESFTAGGGIRYGIVGNLAIRVDYAFQKFGRLKDVHQFALGILF